MLSRTQTLGQLRKAYRSYTEQNRAVGDLDSDAFVNERHRSLIAEGDEAEAGRFPSLGNLSAGFLNRFVPVPHVHKQPEFVYVPSSLPNKWEEPRLTESVFITEWNSMWEAGQLRHETLGGELPRRLRWLRDYQEQNIFLLPRSWHRYYAYAVLFHMVPRSVLERHDLPLLRRGLWPHFNENHWRESVIPRDFDKRLANAFADVVWNHLVPGSGHGSFSASDPVKLLAHNLDYWLPSAHAVAENRLRLLPIVEATEEEEAELRAAPKPRGVKIRKPRMGGMLWEGEHETREAVVDLVDTADKTGQLRAILDAVRSHRVEEDFSDRWSFAREDFERKLYRKRAKVKVKFVELTDTIPVHGPESEVLENLMWEDFMGLLNKKERMIVVLLRSGVTNLGDIATEVGYATHSPISKALKRIRLRAKQILE